MGSGGPGGTAGSRALSLGEEKSLTNQGAGQWEEGQFKKKKKGRTSTRELAHRSRGTEEENAKGSDSRGNQIEPEKREKRQGKNKNEIEK